MPSTNPKKDVSKRIEKALGLNPVNRESRLNQLEVSRFIKALNQYLVKNKLSQRKGSINLEITIGTMTKYLRGEVNPFDVKTRITRNLARELGVTPEALYTYFETGEYKDSVTIQDVESWITSSISADDLPRILNALSHSQNKDQVIAKPSKPSAPRKPTAAECKKTGQLAAQHFQNIQREEVISAKAAWKSFVESEFSQMVETDHLNAILDVLRGEAVLTLEAMSEIYLTYGRCPVVTAFRKISELPLEVEFAQLVHNAELYIADQASKQNKSFEMSVVDV